MSNIVMGPWGDSNATGVGTSWKWKPSGPITRIDMFGSTNGVWSIAFKSHTDSVNFGNSNSYDNLQFGLDLKPSEYLIGISGAYADWGPSYNNTKYLTSLSFETNLGNVTKPWPGSPSRTINASVTNIQEFSYKTKDGSAIIGVHGLYGCGPDQCVNSIGIYENPSPPPPTPFILSDIVIGPWGDSNATRKGTPWKWKPSGPITRIDMFGNINGVWSIAFKSHNDSLNFGSSRSYDRLQFSFDLKPSEYLIGISGAYADWGPSYNNTKYLTSLSFETNLGNITKPWPGSPNRTIYTGVTNIQQFSHKTKDGSAITGVHGFYGCGPETPDQCINSIGIYENRSPPSPPPTPFILPKSNSEDVTIVGPWGGLDGNSWKYEPKDPITQIDIGFEPGYRVNYIRFKITPAQQSQYYGSTNGNLTEGKVYIDSPSEYLSGVRGTYKFLDDTRKMILESLTFLTSEKKVYGPYGGANSGYPFQYEIKRGVSIVGFFGLIDNYLNTLGVFVKPLPLPPLNPVVFVKEWGGSGGKAWKFQPNGVVTQIVIMHSNVIHSLMFKSDDGNESEKFGGNGGGTKSIVDIKKGVSLKGIKGTFGKRGFYTVVTSLSFDTSDGEAHGPFGEYFGTEFSLCVEGSIVGFHGYAGALINAIGVYLKP